jgi:hypothetical protein
MKRAAAVLIALALALLVDTRLSIFGARADVLSIVVYRFALARTPLAGMSFGALAGLAEDGLLSLSVGPSLLGKSVVGFAAPHLSHAFFRWTPLLGFFGAMALTWAGGLAEFACLTMFGGLRAELSGGLYPLLVQGGINGVLGAFLGPGEKAGGGR